MDFERRLFRHAFIVLWVAFVAWTLLPEVDGKSPGFPRVHAAGAFLGILIVALGAAWRSLSLSEALGGAAYWCLVVSAYVGLGSAITVTVLARSAPEPSGFVTPNTPAWVTGLGITTGIVMMLLTTVATGLVLYGTRRPSAA